MTNHLVPHGQIDYIYIYREWMWSSDLGRWT